MEPRSAEHSLEAVISNLQDTVSLLAIAVTKLRHCLETSPGPRIGAYPVTERCDDRPGASEVLTLLRVQRRSPSA